VGTYFVDVLGIPVSIIGPACGLRESSSMHEPFPSRKATY